MKMGIHLMPYRFCMFIYGECTCIISTNKQFKNTHNEYRILQIKISQNKEAHIDKILMMRGSHYISVTQPQAGDTHKHTWVTILTFH